MPKRAYRIVDDPEEETISYFSNQMTIQQLATFREKYHNYPPFQRDKVWPEKYKFEFIDSIVKNYLTPDILFTPTPYDPDRKWIIDGQQRTECILEFFDALEADKAGLPIPRHEDGTEYFYFPLTERQEQRFRSYVINFKELVVKSPRVLTIIFLRWQNQVILTTAEKLWASASKVNDIAKVICSHPFFREIYEGKSNRKQSFQMSVYPIMAEMFNLFSDMKSTRLKLIVRGSRDDLVKPEMEKTINRRLTYVTKLFQGVRAGAMTELIIMYQCVWLLEFIGADLDKMEVGALTPWYALIEDLNTDSRARGFMNLFAQMTHNKVQKEWWGKWIEDIVYNPMDIVKFANEDAKKAGEAQMQRFTGWLRHNGICPHCHARHVQLAQVKKHCFRPQDLTNNGISNCKNSPLTKKQELAMAGAVK